MKQILTFSAYDYYVDSFEKSTKQLNDLYRLQENLPSLNEIDALAERRLPHYPLFLVWVLALIETSQISRSSHRIWQNRSGSGSTDRLCSSTTKICPRNKTLILADRPF